jgi:Mg2+ and Co2+ transporter CorA
MNLPPDEKPPVFNSWRSWYVLVVGFLAALIVFFYFFTKYFS